MGFSWQASSIEYTEMLFARHMRNTAILFLNKKEKCEANPFVMINLTLAGVHADYDMVDYDEIQIIYFKVSIEKVEEKS